VETLLLILNEIVEKHRRTMLFLSLTCNRNQWFDF